MSEETIEIRVVFKGHVQGVGFRATTRHYANKLGVAGTVKNLPDGSVELIAQGPLDRINELIHALTHRSFASAVTSSVKEKRPILECFQGFKIIH